MKIDLQPKIHLMKAAIIAALLCLAVVGSAAGDMMEGPKSVTEDLKPGDGLKSPQFRSQFFKERFSPWFEFKDNLNKDYHLNLGFDYTVVGALSSSDMGDSEAMGHDLRFYGTWTPLNPDGPNPGSLTAKVENREAFTNVAPQDMGFDSGAVAINAAQFSDAQWVLSNLYWKQRIADGRFTFGFGQIDVTDFMDVYPLASPVWGFQNLVFSVSPAIAAPNMGIGIGSGIWISENIYANASIADANADPASPDFDVFDTGETFQHIEIGYTPSRDLQFLKNVHLTFWHSDAREEADVPEDWGVSASCSWLIRNTWAPFLRVGWADDRAALYDASISAGFGYLTRQQDLFGLGVNWAQPAADEDLDDQWTLEAFYKYQVTQILAVSLDIQQIVNPALNDENHIIGIYNIRARIVF